MRLRRPPLIPLPPRRHVAPAPQPGYGVGYRPDWPSILSVAHDTADGGRLFVVTDRPCVIVPGPLTLPLSVAGAGGPSVVAATEVLAVMFRVRMSGAVPAGAAWAWGSGASALIDPVSNHAPNPAAGFCADTPGPYPPPAAPTLVAAEFGPDGDAAYVRLAFDRPISIAGLDATQVRVFEGPPGGTLWQGAGAGTPVAPDAVRIDLQPYDPFAGPGVTLDATPATGIVAADDGSAWAGAGGVALPYP
jgi:hypothetical protein